MGRRSTSTILAAGLLNSWKMTKMCAVRPSVPAKYQMALPLAGGSDHRDSLAITPPGGIRSGFTFSENDQWKPARPVSTTVHSGSAEAVDASAIPRSHATRSRFMIPILP